MSEQPVSDESVTDININKLQNHSIIMKIKENH